jgi:hypothetical protein
MLVNHTTQPDQPLPRIQFCFTIAAISALTLAICSAHSRADGTASYSFDQTNLDANSNPVIHAKTVGPVPVPLSETESTPNSSYVFNVSGLQKSPTSLATRASFSVDVDQENASESWLTSKANAMAEASLVDFATVQGAGGATSGTIVFNWVVTGAATLSLDTTPFNVVQVNDLSTSAKLESTIPNSMGSLLDVTHAYPDPMSNKNNWQENHPIASDVVTFDVPWQANTEMPVFFDLSSTANLDITNLDASGFTAGLDIDLSNTAILRGVGILDDTGTKLPDAQLVSRGGFVYPKVPEPNGLSLFAIGLLFLRSVTRRRSSVTADH